MSCLCAPQCWPKVVITEWCVRVTPCGIPNQGPFDLGRIFVSCSCTPQCWRSVQSEKKKSCGCPPRPRTLRHGRSPRPRSSHRDQSPTRARETSTIVSGPFTHTPPSSVTTIRPGFGDCAAAHPSLGHCATTIQQGLGHCVWSVTQASTVVSSPRLRSLCHNHPPRLQ